jgi:hypothetical protein
MAERCCAGVRVLERVNVGLTLLLHPGCVGKTSLCLRYVQNAFNDKHITTIQASYLVKRLNIDGKRVQLSIWVSSNFLNSFIRHL